MEWNRPQVLRGLQRHNEVNRESHPVWEVYDLHRTARLNVKYYSALLHRAEMKNFWLEFILLCSAPGSAVAGIWFWETPVGHDVWKWLAVVAAVAAILKPLLSLTNKIKDYESLLSGYRTLVHDLEELRSDIRNKGKYDQTAQKNFKRAMKRKGTLVGKETDSKEDKKLNNKCRIEVEQELPAADFSVPEE